MYIQCQVHSNSTNCKACMVHCSMYKQYVVQYVVAVHSVCKFCHRFNGILKFMNTICPGVAGLVSWTAESSVVIFLVKLLPLDVTMVMVSPRSVACTGISTCESELLNIYYVVTTQEKER